MNRSHVSNQLFRRRNRNRERGEEPGHADHRRGKCRLQALPSSITFRPKAFSSANSFRNKKKFSCREFRFPAYLASVRGPVCLSVAITALLVISTSTARAQALVPSKLHLAGRDQETKKDKVQGVTGQTPPAIKKDTVEVITRETPPVVKKDTAQVITKQTPQVVTKERATEPIRPVARYSYKTPEGKKESAPVITHYYPKQIVHPFAKIDRHLDPKLMQAATIAQERAHAHSRSMCWHYVKEALLASGVIDSRPKSEYARDAAQDLVSNYGFKKLPVKDPFAAPIGSVLVYGSNRAAGHVEFRTKDGFVSDFRSLTPSRRPLIGVYAKL